MAVEIYAFDVTVPGGTARGNPAVIPMNMPARVVERIEIMVPPGASGSTGFQLASGGTPIIPRGGNTFIIASPGTLNWDLEQQITSGAWQALAYNTGAYAHYLQVRFFVSLLPSATAAAGTAAVSNADLSTPLPVYTVPDGADLAFSSPTGQ